MSTNPASTLLIGAIPKAPDLECHVRVIEVENIKVVELRDYIPSLQEYGRGYWMPMDENSVFSVIAMLTEAINGNAK